MNRSPRLAIFFLPFFLSALLPSCPLAAQPSALEIMQQVQQRDTGSSSTAEVEMTLISQNGSRRVRQLKLFSKTYELFTSRSIYFQAPADVHGTAFLIRDYKAADQEDEQWLYLPALRKTKRISTSDKGGAFMGSDLNYADMGSDSLDESTYTLVKEDMVDGHPVWVIEAHPTTEEYALKKGYTKSLLLIRKDNYVIVRSVNWLLNSTRMRYMNVVELEKIDSIWAPTMVRIWTTENRTTIHQTLLQTRNLRFNVDLSDDLFSLRQLETGY